MSNNALDLFRSAKDEIPDIKFTIPSTGEDIFLRPFTTREQKVILKAMEKEDQLLINEAFDHLIKNCVITKGFKVDDLLTKDRDALLIELRKESVRDDFSFNWKCNHCDNVNSENMSLDKLKFNKLKDKKSLTKDIKLSDRDIIFRLELPTRKFEKMLFKYVSNGTKEVSAVDVLNTTLAVSISKLIIPPKDDEVSSKELDVDFKTRISMLEEMSIDDKKKIEDFLQGIESYGYDLNVGKKVCKQCSESTEVELNWSDFFLM